MVTTQHVNMKRAGRYRNKIPSHVSIDSKAEANRSVTHALKLLTVNASILSSRAQIKANLNCESRIVVTRHLCHWATKEMSKRLLLQSDQPETKTLPGISET